MSLIVAGTVRVPPESLGQLRPHMAAMLAATRVEDGCLDYANAEEVAEPGLIRIFERWRGWADLTAHFKTPHMAAWRAAAAEAGLFDRRLVAYEVASERSI